LGRWPLVLISKNALYIIPKAKERFPRLEISCRLEEAMSVGMIVVFGILGLAGLALIALGYFLGMKKKTNLLFLLAGYDESRVKDEEALARVTGPFLIVLGIYLCSTPFLVYRFGPHKTFVPFIVLVVLGTIFVNLYCRYKEIT